MKKILSKTKNYLNPTYTFHKKLKFVNFMANIDIAKLETDLMDQGGMIAKRWGFGEPLGRVFVAMLASDEPLSQKGIGEKTGYSLSLVSPTLRILESQRMVRSFRGEGKERLYEPVVNFIEGASIMVTEFLERDVRPGLKSIDMIDKSELGRKKNLVKVAKSFKRLEVVLTSLEKMLLMRRATHNKIRRLLK